MKIPKKEKIGGHIFKVICPYKFKERADIDGMTDFDLNEIRIKAVDNNGSKVAQSNIEETFWHEITHIIEKIYCHASLTEEQVMGISQGLHQVLTDNFLIQPKEK